MKRICLVFAISFIFCAANAQKAVKTFTITAHSGAYSTEDNSMQYIETALAHNDEILELDVRCRPDGSLAMSHDEIKGNTDGVDISKVLEHIKGHRTQVNLDIKETRTLPDLYRTVHNLGMEKQVFLTGIETKDIDAVKRICPDLVYYLNCMPEKKSMRHSDYRNNLIKMLRETGAAGVNCNYRFCTRRLVSLLHSNGFKVSIWTVNEEKDMRKYTRLCPDNITTRHPDLLRKVIEKHK